MPALEHISRFIEEGGTFMYYRAWRGRRATAPLRRRLIVAVLGTLGLITLALFGFIANVAIIMGAIADPSVSLVFHALIEALNLVYLGVGLAIGPGIVAVRALFFELEPSRPQV